MRFSVRLRAAALLFAAVLLLPACSKAQTADVPGCLPDEGVVFSCRLHGNRRTVALCSSPKTLPFDAMIYRYGSGTRNEVAYVANRDGHDRFLATVSPVSPKASVRQIWFESKGTKYVLTSCVGGDCPHRGGLIVFQGTRLLLSQSCTNDAGSQPWFSRDVVRFGSDLDSSHSNTDLIQLQDFDNHVDVLYPFRPVN